MGREGRRREEKGGGDDAMDDNLRCWFLWMVVI